MDDARGGRDGLDAAQDILSSDDQSWPRIVQHLAQPVGWILRIQGDKGASRRQARQHGQRKHRTRRQYDADQLSRSGFARDGFGQSGEAIPQFRIRERCVRVRHRDTVSMPARHALKMIDDRPIQIFVAKPGENPAGGAVPVERVLTVLEPLQALTLRGTAARVADDCNWIQVSHSPAMSERRMAALSTWP
jgi:hypothetical protein